jgi:DNA transformation protein and related proteins
MSTKQSTAEFLLDQVRPSVPSGRILKIFGEYALYVDEKVVALICDDQLYVKPTKAGQTYLSKVELAPPYPGAKPHFLISGEYWDDGEWLAKLLNLTAEELPLPKKKGK